MRITTKLVVVLALVAACSAQAGEWQRYTNEDGNLSVLTPTLMKEVYSKDSEVETAHTLQAMGQDAAYGVIYDKAKRDRDVNQENFDAFASGFFSSVGECKVLDEAAPTRVLTNYIGKWYRLACTAENSSVNVELNLYWGKRYAYVVMVAWPPTASTPEISKFLDSFRLLDTSR